MSHGNNGPRTDLNTKQYPERFLESLYTDVKNQNLKGRGLEICVFKSLICEFEVRASLGVSNIQK